MRLDLVTGRTDQLRPHLAKVGRPIVGADEYGSREKNRHAHGKWGLTRQFLHAARLQFAHPVSQAALDLRAPLWSDLRIALTRAGFAPEDIPDWILSAADKPPGAP